MDDLLIVRLSERSKERFTRRRAHAGLGAHLAFVLAAPFAVIVFAQRESLFGAAAPLDSAYPFLAAGIVLALSLVLFTLLGRYLKPSHARRPFRSPRLYDGLPSSHESDPAPERTDAPPR